MESKPQNNAATRLFNGYLLLAFLACCVVLVILFITPADPKNAWFLGYSRSRMMMVGSVFIPVIIFFSGLLYLSGKKTRESADHFFLRLREWSFFPVIIEIVTLVLLISIIIIVAFHRYLYSFLGEEVTFLQIIVRINPIVILSEVLIVQTLVFLFILRGEILKRRWYRSFAEIYSFPNLVISSLKRISSFFNQLFHTIDRVFERLANRAKRKMVIGLIIVTPTVLTTALVWFFFEASIIDYIPIGSDEMVYWREMLTFKSVGFEGGQYSTNELPAAVEFSHFGSHGPGFAMLYGGIGKLFGWQYYSGVILNIFFLTAGLAAFIILTRPTNKQLLILWLVLVTYWPLWVYIPTTRVLSLHMTIALFMAGMFYKLITFEKKSPFFTGGLFIFIIAAGFIRMTWSLLFIPYFYALVKGTSWQRTIKAILLSIFPSVLVVIYFRLFASPYPSVLYNFLDAFATSWGNLFSALSNHIKRNLVDFFAVDKLIMVVLLRFQLLWLLIVIVVDFFRNSWKDESQFTEYDQNVSLFNTSNIFLLFLLNAGLYVVHSYQDYRVFAPHVFLSLLILIFSSRRHLVWGIIIANLLFTFSFGSVFQRSRASSFLRDRTDMQVFQEATADFLIYEPRESRWCNTLDISRYSSEASWTPVMLTVPAEYGITSILNWKIFYDTKLKAKYVVLEPDYIDERYPFLLEGLNLEFLTETPIGNLYFNEDSNCTR